MRQLITETSSTLATLGQFCSLTFKKERQDKITAAIATETHEAVIETTQIMALPALVSPANHTVTVAITA